MTFDILIRKNGKYLQCKRCYHYWIYTGNNPYVTSCPKCKTSVLVNFRRKETIKEYEPVSHEYLPKCPEEHGEKCNILYRKPAKGKTLLICVCECNHNCYNICSRCKQNMIKDGEDNINVISKGGLI